MGTFAPNDGQPAAPVEQQAAPESAPAPPAEQAPVAAEGPAAPQVPTVPQQQVPQVPQVQAPGIQPDTAVEFAQAFADPRTRDDAFLRTAQQYGYVPQGLTVPELMEAAALYAEMKAQPPADGQYQDPQYQDPQQFQQGPPQAPTLGPEDVQQLVQQSVQQQLTSYQQQQVHQQQLTTIQQAAQQVAQQAGLNEHQANRLLRNIALDIDEAQSQGAQIDFSPQAITQFAEAVRADLFGAAQAQQFVDTNQQIAQHRAIAPQTTTPMGAPQSGGPATQRGVRGAAARIRQAQAANRAGG